MDYCTWTWLAQYIHCQNLIFSGQRTNMTTRPYRMLFPRQVKIQMLVNCKGLSGQSHLIISGYYQRHIVLLRNQTDLGEWAEASGPLIYVQLTLILSWNQLGEGRLDGMKYILQQPFYVLNYCCFHWLRERSVFKKFCEDWHKKRLYLRPKGLIKFYREPVQAKGFSRKQWHDYP